MTTSIKNVSYLSLQFIKKGEMLPYLNRVEMKLINQNNINYIYFILHLGFFQTFSFVVAYWIFKSIVDSQ